MVRKGGNVCVSRRFYGFCVFSLIVVVFLRLLSSCLCVLSFWVICVMSLFVFVMITVVSIFDKVVCLGCCFLITYVSAFYFIHFFKLNSTIKTTRLIQH